MLGERTVVFDRFGGIGSHVLMVHLSSFHQVKHIRLYIIMWHIQPLTSLNSTFKILDELANMMAQSEPFEMHICICADGEKWEDDNIYESMQDEIASGIKEHMPHMRGRDGFKIQLLKYIEPEEEVPSVIAQHVLELEALQ